MATPESARSKHGGRLLPAALATLCALAVTLLAPAPAGASFGFLDTWGSPGSGPGEFNSPSGIVADSAGNVYVADTFNNRVQVFDACHTYAGEWGSFGNGPGQLSAPLGVAISADDRIYVADTNNNRIAVFNPGGGFAGGWGGLGPAPGQFRLPFDVAIGPDGNVYVADTDNNRIQEFDSAGTFITQWGRFGSGNGQFNEPFGIAVGPDGTFTIGILVFHHDRLGPRQLLVTAAPGGPTFTDKTADFLVVAPPLQPPGSSALSFLAPDLRVILIRR